MNLVDSSQVKQTAFTSSSSGIWSSILSEASSSKAIPNKHVVIVGDSFSGKSTLLQCLSSSMKSSQSNPNLSPNGKTAASMGFGASSESANATSVHAASVATEKSCELALSFTYLDLQDDDDNEVVSRIGLYQLAGHPSYAPLLKFALNERTLEQDLALVIVLDWTRPWDFIKSLEKWIEIVEKRLLQLFLHGYSQPTTENTLFQTINSGDTDTMKAEGKKKWDILKLKVEKYLQEFSDIHAPSKSATHLPLSDKVLLPLGPGVLTKNIGIPIVVVCHKSDFMVNLEQEKNYSEEDFDFIQQMLRTVCLQYGAALFYTTVHRPETMDRLRSYVIHRLMRQTALSNLHPLSTMPSTVGSNRYSFPYKAEIVIKDSVLVPAGWDSWSKIRVLRDGFECEEMATETVELKDGSTRKRADIYQDIIVNMAESPKVHTDLELKIESESEFLEKQAEIMQRGGLLHESANTPSGNTTEDILSRLHMSSSEKLKQLLTPLGATPTSKGRDKTFAGLNSGNTPSHTPLMALKNTSIADPSSLLMSTPLTSSSNSQTPLSEKRTIGKLSALSSTAHTPLETPNPTDYLQKLGMDGTPGSNTLMSPGNNEMIANFFQSLLTRKGTTPSSSLPNIRDPPSSNNSPSVSSKSNTEMATELGRMLHSVRKPSQD